MAASTKAVSFAGFFEEPARRREGLTSAPALANGVAFPGQPAAAPEDPLLGSLNLTPDGLSGEQFQTEISTTVSIDGRIYVFSSGGGSTLQVSDATNAAAPSLVGRTALGGYTSQSVASYGNLLAVALSPSDYATNGGKGLVRFYRVEADGSLTQLQDVEVGYLPDSIAFNAIGTKLVIANEGEPISGYATDRTKDPVGSIGIIDIAGRVNLRFRYTDLGFAGVTLPEGLRISGPSGTTQATDIEPEYVSVLGNYAYVTLQENNGVAKVNLIHNTIEKIFALGAVDYRTQLVDLTDRDNPTGTTGFFKPLLGQAYEGLRMADGIAAYSVRGKDFFVTANEGDGRDGFPWASYTDEARGTGNANRVKRLTDDQVVGSADRITTFGSRSISSFDAESGALLWDSGNTLQTIAVAAGMYADSRSDDKGVEPEGIVVAQLHGRSYAIASLERTTSSMLVVFDMTDPSAGQFVTSTVINGSVSPEGLHIVEAKQSPTGRAQLVVSNELSNTLNVLDLEALIAAPPVAGAGSFASTMLKDVEGGPELDVANLITNGEFTNGLNPGDSVYAPTGIFDGLGAYDNGDGTLTVLANSELGNTVGYGYLVDGVALTGARISKFIIDKDIDDDASNGYQSAMISGGIAYREIIDAEGNAVTSAAQLNGGFARFCSSSYEQADRFGAGRGFVDSIYLTGEEADEGLLYALDTESEVIHALAGLGRAGWETAVQVDTGSVNTVGVLLMDDNTAPIYLWVGEKSTATGASFLERNGLAAGQGNLYTWVPTGGSIGTTAGTAGVPDSADLNALALGTAAAGSWVLVGTGTQVALLNEAQLRTTAIGLGALQLSRLEDASINPTDGQQVVFATTGNGDFAGADTFGNLITLDLSGAFDGNGLIAGANSTGLTVIYDGDRQIAAWDEAFGDNNGLIDSLERASFGATIIRNPDNLTWSADGSIYVQEDRSVDKAFFAEQEASIWQVSSTTTDPVTGQAMAQRWMQIDRNAVPTAYGQTDPRAAGGTNPDPGNWETSGIIDVSDIYGAVAGSLFLADVQAHSLVNGNIAGNGYLAQGGQLNLIQNSDLV
ncbi:MAG: choice-of-anchor I family protein [Cyanobacteriota bacterium]